MLDAIIMPMIEFFKGLGYFGVALALCFEFIPAEAVLPLAGYWISQGEYNYYLMVLAGTIGGTIGPLTLYMLGRFGGRPLAVKYGKYFLVNEKQLNAADVFFAKYGAGVAFFARFMPIVRTAISVPCGMMKMSVWKFSAYTFAAMLPITALYVYLGIKLGENWKQAGELFKDYLQPFVIIIVVLLVIYGIYKYRQKLLERKLHLKDK
ncbi:DedA family protein [Lysinibacillus odysseyi]|uniref:Alkaline phosphatase n=1 Tax=Lysinibacillus odysseyi 34hs-1 = NBRC 100172 TaxID=1220589 RepID=A0A0A3JDB1_9BACI|nr:DedA family protein [Lysinibacillus odysseyi]KGR85022.1 alkaline phosphatase [Lysinibacillus odysseyi 34hs-1 = NBRC 100172]